MVKVRFHGLPEECKQFAEWLHTQPNITIHTESDNYADRGSSQYVRKYFDITVTPPEQLLKEYDTRSYVDNLRKNSKEEENNE